MSANGQMKNDELSAIPGGRLAKGGPARSWIAMRYYIGRKTGVWLRPTGPAASYRPLAKQEEFYKNYLSGRGPLAAVPGTSNHGLGHAVDTPTEAMHAQIRRYGHRFGWGIKGGKLASDAPSEEWHSVYRGRYTPSARFWFARHRLSRRKHK